MENIVLVGFMGTGKTSVAREISRILGFPHFETDKLISQAEGCEINEIFETHGEQYFRDKEFQLLQDLLSKDKNKSVICTGGGMPIQKRNREILKQLGFVVWLKTTPEETYNRIAQGTSRPLLNTPNPMETIQKLMAARESFYREVAMFEIDTVGLNSSELANGVVDSANYFFSKF